MPEESVVVGVRVRPFNAREEALNATCCIEMEGPATSIVTSDGKRSAFTFDESFWSHDGFDTLEDGRCVPSAGSSYADQQYVFETFGVRVLDNAWAGFHCCLFAYGQTGAGKSYSMLGYGVNKGIVPISCEEIFRRTADNSDQQKRFEVCVSMVEIYNETVQDLFCEILDRPKKGLEIRESKMLGIYIDGVSKRPVDSYEAIQAVLDEGTENRSVGSTLMNATSSRAHTVLTIEFKQVTCELGKEQVKISMINLVDLAGSEKAGQTGASGDRLKEGCAINKSLTALGNVIEKLAERSASKKKDVLIPYRNSKLTRLLQNALGGSSRTIMVCALSPASSNYEETLSTLRYADRAKKIKNNATVNENPQDRLMRELREENERLKLLFDKGGGIEVSSEIVEKKAEIERVEASLQEMQRSFQEKLRDSKIDQQHKSSKSKRFSLFNSALGCTPYLANLNEDMQLCGKVRIQFPEGETIRFTSIQKKDRSEEESEDSGSSSSSSSSSNGSGSGDRSGSSRKNKAEKKRKTRDAQKSDVMLTGPDVFVPHASIVNKNGKCMVNCFSDEAAHNTFVNGDVLTVLFSQVPERRDEGVELVHGARVVFGRMIFVFVEPAKTSLEIMILTGDVNFAKAKKELRQGFHGRATISTESPARARAQSSKTLKPIHQMLDKKNDSDSSDTDSLVSLSSQAAIDKLIMARSELLFKNEAITKLERDLEKFKQLKDNNNVQSARVAVLRGSASIRQAKRRSDLLLWNVQSYMSDVEVAFGALERLIEC
eukprot:TRINITY_DN10764_c2_g1_i1.p1 TRINITY_DN10764_c2_g1~~TRINITY_DN10764_c2_g1_i1.p1  ORF type:complete len:773 (+),score=152.12 TRINITY_DN10764_c2_g1_i1:60-2378(+)